MITVKKAESLVLEQIGSFGVEKVSFLNSLNRVLSKPIIADRNYPPFNRATMDGIAISFGSYKKGIRDFTIIAMLAAGQKPIGIKKHNESVQIMTGAVVASSCDTVIPVEDLVIKNGIAKVATNSVEKGQFVHKKGIDKKKGDVVIKKGQIVTSEMIPVLASVGAKDVVVAKLPSVVILTTGDELVNVDQKPNDYQIRRSNDYAIWALISAYGIKADTVHVKDDKDEIRNIIKELLQKYEVIIISGGVSKGDFDYVYKVLEELRVKKIFHGIYQKPGKPMWFGRYKKRTTVFALPGNPVSTFLCVNRYIIPWLRKSLGVQNKRVCNTAVLENDTASNPSLTLFTQVALSTDKKGTFLARPLVNNGSGDFMSMVGADAFVELPAQKNPYKKGVTCKIWPIKNIS